MGGEMTFARLNSKAGIPLNKANRPVRQFPLLKRLLRKKRSLNHVY